MKRTFLFFSIFIISAQGAFSQTAASFNSKMQTIVDSIDILENDWSRQYADISTDDKNFSLLGPSRMKMEAYLNQKTEELEDMKDMYGSKRLRRAVLDYIAVEKNVLNNALIPIEHLNSTVSPMELSVAATKLTEESEKEEDQLDVVTEEQAAYARRNGTSVPDVASN